MFVRCGVINRCIENEIPHVLLNIYTHARMHGQIMPHDDHDRCERVNVSTGTGSPVLSRDL